ncbi:hypothetical protein MKB11_005001 [Salmonella enterica]|nr:hypothetical protein [Salmonella enterica]
MTFNPTHRFSMAWLNDALSSMNDRINALEAEHESAIDAFEDGFSAGEKRLSERDKAISEFVAHEITKHYENKLKALQPAPEVEPTTEDSKNELEQVEQASETIRSHMKKWGIIAFTIHAGEIA